VGHATAAEALDVVGELELQLDATTTAADTGWIVTLQDVDRAGNTYDVTAGWLRASLRAVDEERSVPGAPVLPCTRRKRVRPGKLMRSRIPIVPNARRFEAGHRIRVVVASDDTAKGKPSISHFRHAPVGEPARNAVHSCSRPLLPVSGGEPPRDG
jgi:hypothetical protein